MEPTIQLTLKQGAHIARETDQELSDTNISASTIAFNLGIDEILTEIAVHHITKLEIDQIEAESIYHEAWGELEKENEQLHHQLIQNASEVAIKSFIRGFTSGYKLLKLINDKKDCVL